jgi:hypothetical protein
VDYNRLMWNRFAKTPGLLTAFGLTAAILMLLSHGRGAAQTSDSGNIVSDVFTRNPLQVALLQWYPANLVTSFAAGIGAERVAFDGANIWVTNVGDANNGTSVTKMSANDGTLLGTFQVGEAPVGIAYDGANMWVSDYAGNKVSKVRASDGAVVASSRPAQAPAGWYSMAPTSGRRTIWITT